MKRAKRRKFSIAKKLRIIRDRKKMKLKEISNKYGITYAQFYKWYWEFVGKITELAKAKRGAK